MEPVFDQRSRDYFTIDCGRGTFAATGCEAAAVYNAMLFHGRPTALQTVSDEFRRLRIRWLGGRWGGYPRRIGRFFRDRGVPFRFVTRPEDFVLEEGGVAVCSFWNEAKGAVPVLRWGLHTVALYRQEDGYAVFNLRGGSSSTFHRDLAGIIGEGKFICGYLLPRRPAGGPAEKSPDAGLKKG